MPPPASAPAPDQQAGGLALERLVRFDDAVLAEFARSASFAPWPPFWAMRRWTLAFRAIRLARRSTHRHAATA